MGQPLRGFGESCVGPFLAILINIKSIIRGVMRELQQELLGEPLGRQCQSPSTGVRFVHYRNDVGYPDSSSSADSLSPPRGRWV